MGAVGTMGLGRERTEGRRDGCSGDHGWRGPRVDSDIWRRIDGGGVRQDKCLTK